MSLIEEHVQQTTSQASQSKEEFMLSCLADGTAREVCEGRWNAAHQTSPDVTEPAASPGGAGGIKDVLRENEMLRAQLKVREDQLKQAITIANRANAETNAKNEAQKQMLVNSIQMDSHFKKEELENKRLNELQTIRLTLDKTMAKTFASVAADMDAAKRKRKPYLTAGAWDPEKRRWVGGI